MQEWSGQAWVVQGVLKFLLSLELFLEEEKAVTNQRDKEIVHIVFKPVVLYSY